MAYTLQQLDDAIRAVLGDDKASALLGPDGEYRPQAHRDAMVEAFYQRLDNQHTDLLRDAWADAKRGIYRPEGGWDARPSF